MPWQRLVADVGLELLDDGRPAFRQVIVTVPRQSGKTTLILAWEIQRAIYWAAKLRAPQTVIYSAQTQKDAREKLVDEQFPVLEPHRRALDVRTFRRAIGSEGIFWRNGSRLGLLAGTETSGHGKTLDLAVKDELFADPDFRRDQSMSPAMITRPFAQMFTASTMGTVASVALNAEVELGRAAVDAGKREGVAYFEWSASPDDDPESPDVWARCMPALNITVPPDLIRLEFEKFAAEGAIDEFRRAYLNVPTATDERVIPSSAWLAVCGPAVEATADVFGVDVNPERSAAAICAAGEGPALEMVDHRQGVGWILGRAVELHQRFGAPFALERRGPAGSLAQPLSDAGVSIIEIDGPDMTRACGQFYDAVLDQSVSIRTDDSLNAAVSVAARRPVGDAWAWGRKSSKGDISPLIAATVALGAFQAKAGRPPQIWDLNEVVAQIRAERAAEEPPAPQPSGPKVPEVTFHPF